MLDQQNVFRADTSLFLNLAPGKGLQILTHAGVFGLDVPKDPPAPA